MIVEVRSYRIKPGRRAEFPSLDERERMRTAFYEGKLWKNELEAIAMPMRESYDVILCETSPGAVFDAPRAAASAATVS